MISDSALTRFSNFRRTQTLHHDIVRSYTSSFSNDEALSDEESLLWPRSLFSSGTGDSELDLEEAIRHGRGQVGINVTGPHKAGGSASISREREFMSII